MNRPKKLKIDAELYLFHFPSPSRIGKARSRGQTMAEVAADINRKVKRAAQAILFQRHMKPGVKGWELRRLLGKDYQKIIDLLDVDLAKLGLRVRAVYDDGEHVGRRSEEQLEKATYFVTVENPLSDSDYSSGWRVDDVAVLAVAIAYINSHQGKARRKDVEKLLREKLPNWKIEFSLDRFVKRGYLLEDENEMLHIDWRTRAEIDRKKLMELILIDDRVGVEPEA